MQSIVVVLQNEIPHMKPNSSIAKFYQENKVRCFTILHQLRETDIEMVPFV